MIKNVNKNKNKEHSRRNKSINLNKNIYKKYRIINSLLKVHN